MSPLRKSLADSQESANVLAWPLPTSTRDTDGWERFVSRYGAYLGRCAFRSFLLLGESFVQEDIEDIVQTLYARLLEDDGRRLRQFKGTTEEELLAYLHCIAYRLVVDVWRQARAAKRGGGVSLKLVRDVEGLGEASFDLLPSPEERYLSREGCRRAIRVALPKREDWAQTSLRILRLSLVEGRTSQEIAQVRGISMRPSGVHSSLHRMRRRLADAPLSYGDLQSTA